MPTYVYRREDGTTFEVFQRISADPLTTCPETGQRVERVISGGEGLIFKGTGFYLTDYARKGQKPSGEGAGSGATSEGATKPESSNGTSASSESSVKAPSSSSGSSASDD